MSKPNKDPDAGITNEEMLQVALVVSDAFSVPLTEIIRKNKEVHVCNCRQMIWMILNRRGYSFTAIGKVFKRDHASIINGVRKMTAFVEQCPRMETYFHRVKALINPGEVYAHEYTVKGEWEAKVRSHRPLRPEMVRARAEGLVDIGMAHHDIISVTTDEREGHGKRDN